MTTLPACPLCSGSSQSTWRPTRRCPRMLSALTSSGKSRRAATSAWTAAAPKLLASCAVKLRSRSVVAVHAAAATDLEDLTPDTSQVPFSFGSGQVQAHLGTRVHDSRGPLQVQALSNGALCRYMVVLRLGGVYADIDCECMQPFNQLIRPRDTMVVSWENEFSTAEEARRRDYVRKRQVCTC